MNGLLQSRKFWIAVVTCLVDVLVVVVGQFAPNSAEFIFGIVTPITVLAGVVIAGIAVEDAAEKGAQ
jgi:uncharacterized membrane protein